MTKRIPPDQHKPMGRPKAPIDLKAVENAASIGCTPDEIAAVLGVAQTTFFARKAAEPEINEAIERGRKNGRATLRRLQWQGAQAGNPTMLIWLGKQLLGQRDKFDHAISTPVSAATDADLLAIASAGGSADTTQAELPKELPGVLH